MYYSPPLKRKNKKHKNVLALFHKNNIPTLSAYSIVLFWLLLFPFSCNNPHVSQQNGDTSPPENDLPLPENESLPVSETETKSPLVLLFDSLGLVNIQQLEPTILVELKYATADNFTGKALYPDLHQAYLHPVAAAKLVKAQQILQEQYPAYSLLIYDAARPQHIQRIMWESVAGTPLSRYVANPAKTGLHNYGMAVDLTIADTLQIPLDMGTPFDYFGSKAGITQEDSLRIKGILTREQIHNRRILRNAMRQAGFYPIEGEWWHFNACSLSTAKERYPMIE